MGDAPSPPVGESSRMMYDAFTDAYPKILQIANAGVVPAAQQQLAAAQQVSPALAQIQAQLYQAYGPMMAQTANQIAREQALSQAETDKQVMAGAGKDLVNQAVATQKIADPEFYRQRELIDAATGKLINNIDLSGQITPGEREEMSRRIAQDNQSRGIATAPSQTAVAENAVQFGDKLHQRQNEAKDQLTNALKVANAGLPGLKSGMDTFQISTGRSSMPNAGDNKFIGVNDQLGQGSMGLANNALGQLGQLTQQHNDINANRRDGLDRFNQTFSSVIGSL